jgi:hypothetical protein
MKAIWTIVVLLVLGGLIVLLQPPAEERSSLARGKGPDEALVAQIEKSMEAAATRGPTLADGPRPVPNPAPSPSPAPMAAPMPAPMPAPMAAPSSPASERPVTPIAGLDPAPEPGVAPDPKPLEGRSPSAEPAKPDPATLAAGQRFEPEIPPIAFAEVLPSTFIKLADGSISADDAWTIRGNGTEESPYEVSWEFLASAQDTYTPRLSENKIPARIAFLSGKRVRISGYLAFPLVAQSSGECLLMLNQWDGCCIGVPPTPYDAIEVKLATEIKGWKKHTFNFGAIEGTFTVEPYLIENWLVGLYMMKDASLDREL